ncbi:MAG: phytanoyl-CoA dioxygenase family protein [Gammaproteobacteria bacterium]|nr:phytanoyl-CoA dioxygenase family protein [Gammaproteobacteria bacterium]
MLTPEQLDHYHQQGYVTPDFRLSAEVVDEIREAHSRLIHKHPEYHDYCPAVLAHDLWFLNVGRQSEILDMVQQILGDDFALWNSSFFAKPARTGSKTPWHQDGEYWPINPLATCTVWIAIDEATMENGCLQVIPGSHRSQQLATHHQNDADGLALNLELDEHQFDASQAVPITLQPGQVSLHDIYLYHGSEPNHSDRPRRGMTLRYMPTTSVYQHDNIGRGSRDGVLHMSQRTVYLMRGIDASGKNDLRLRR